MTERDRRSTRRQWWLRLSLSLVIGVGFCFALIRRIELIPPDPWVPAWVVPSYLATLVAYFVFRAGRWHYLVEPLGEVQLADAVGGARAHAQPLGCGAAGVGIDVELHVARDAGRGEAEA